MAHILDLNLVEQPTLKLTLCDDDRTTVHVTVPDLDTVEEFRANETQMRGALTSGADASINASYGLFAQIISNNKEGLVISAEDLRGKYRINIYGLIAIGKAYNSFISEIEKN